MSVLLWIFFQIICQRPHIVSKFPDDVEQFQANGRRLRCGVQCSASGAQQSRVLKQRMTLEGRNPFIDRFHGKTYRLVIRELNGQ
ncbi:hypothetical protein [Camelimonas lactis]|uniref:hypothetical protein n=1 Tax=Camelimonas lactis TaxID=659006 RepID=UPI00104407E9|nr:hypothetical protein [Camelimonas lactis]